MTILCLMGLISAQVTVFTKFVMPNWLLSNLVEDTVNGVRGSGEVISKIVVYPADKPLNYLYYRNPNSYEAEFNWSNFGDKFYVYWSLKNMFDHLKGNELPEIVVISKDSGNKIAENTLGF